MWKADDWFLYVFLPGVQHEVCELLQNEWKEIINNSSMTPLREDITEGFNGALVHVPLTAERRHILGMWEFYGFIKVKTICINFFMPSKDKLVLDNYIKLAYTILYMKVPRVKKSCLFYYFKNICTSAYGIGPPLSTILLQPLMVEVEHCYKCFIALPEMFSSSRWNCKRAAQYRPICVFTWVKYINISLFLPCKRLC